MHFNRRFRWMPSSGVGQGVCRVRAFQSPLGLLVVLSPLPFLEAGIRLDQELGSLVEALSVDPGFKELMGSGGAGAAMWWMLVDGREGPSLCRVRGADGIWSVDLADQIRGEAFQAFLGGLQLSELVETPRSWL